MTDFRTQKLHCFIPLMSSILKCFLTQALQREERVTLSETVEPKQNIITISVDPRTVTGCIYTITKQESKAATDRLKLWKKHNL